MSRQLRLLSAIGLSLVLCGAGRAAELKVYTEESAPYHFTRDGKVVGIAPTC
jgi:polar amino acid transport system substrate-binding protein